MSVKLFPYQTEGAIFLSEKRCAILADEMGLGKTVQAIRAADLVKAKNILVVCPAIARINWQREFEKFSLTHPSLTVTSFESAHKINPSMLFDLLIIDEAHYLKSHTAKRTAAIYGKEGLVRRAARVWALTGTPAPNALATEVWTHLFTFGVTKLSYTDFLKHFCNYFEGSYGVQITGNKPERLAEFQSLMSKIILRRKKEDVMKELPPIRYAHILVERGEVDIEIMDSFAQYIGRQNELKERLEIEKQMVDHILKSETPAESLRALEALANSVSTLRRYTGLQKMDPVANIILDELENNAYQKIVIFAVHRDVIEGLRQRLEKYGALTLYGGHTDETKQRNIDAFQKNPKKRVMIANIRAAGTSVTLTAASQIAFIEQDWVPGNNAQATMRVHRIGQNESVLVRVFGLAESVDERVSNSLKRKMNELTKIFELPQSTEIEIPKLTNYTHDYNNPSSGITSSNQNEDSNVTTETIDEIGELLK